MEAIDILRRARALISDPSRWTQRAAARDARGAQCNTDSPRAVRWCAVGALWRAESDAGGDAAKLAHIWAGELVERTARAVHGVALSRVNDRHGHAAVLAVYDRAIAIARAAA